MVNTKEIHIYNVIFSKTLTRLVTILAKYFFSNLNPASYLKMTWIWTEILVSVHSFRIHICCDNNFFLSVIGVATIFVSKNTVSSWLNSIVNFLIFFTMFSFIYLVFPISLFVQVRNDIKKLLSPYCFKSSSSIIIFA